MRAGQVRSQLSSTKVTKPQGQVREEPNRGRPGEDRLCPLLGFARDEECAVSVLCGGQAAQMFMIFSGWYSHVCACHEDRACYILHVRPTVEGLPPRPVGPPERHEKHDMAITWRSQHRLSPGRPRSVTRAATR